jgi:hypothetical protein
VWWEGKGGRVGNFKTRANPRKMTLYNTARLVITTNPGITQGGRFCTGDRNEFEGRKYFLIHIPFHSKFEGLKAERNEIA